MLITPYHHLLILYLKKRYIAHFQIDYINAYLISKNKVYPLNSLIHNYKIRSYRFLAKFFFF